MSVMRKLLLLLFLVIPQFGHAILPNYCRRFQLPGWWGSGEYMLVWRKKRFYPPLATTSNLGTPFIEAGVLGFPTTQILFGDEHVGNSPQSGGRFDAGFWLTPCLGFGATWTVFGKEHVNFSIEGNEAGIPIIAVPFFNTDTGEQGAERVSFPEFLGFGELDIHTTNNIWALDLYATWRLWDCRCWHVELLGGFRYTRLNDSLSLNTSTVDIVNDTNPFFNFVFETFDYFNAENSFYGGLVGVAGDYRFGRWAFRASGRFGIGNMVKKVRVDGRTVIEDPTGGSVVFSGGIFAEPTNIGNHSDNSFEVVTEADAQVGVYVWSNLMVTAGYHFMYWPKIFLAGDQIDTQISADGIGNRPQFLGRDSNFWTQSLTVGIYFLY